MDQNELEYFYKKLEVYGTDFKFYSSDPMLSKYSVGQLESAYIHLISHLRKVIKKQGGSTEIKQIKDVYRINSSGTNSIDTNSIDTNANVCFDVLSNDGNIKSVQLPVDRKSKFYTMMKDYEYYLKGKLNILKSCIDDYETHGSNS